MYKTEVVVKKILVEKLLSDFCFPERFQPMCRKCPSFGKVWSCPPGMLSCHEYFKKYKNAYVIGIKVIYDKKIVTKANTKCQAQKIRFLTHSKVKKLLTEILHALEKLNKGSSSLGAGRCEICTKCARTESKPCIYPSLSRYSFTAFGFDMSSIAERLLNIELKWAEQGLPEYDVAIAAFLTEE